MTELAVQRFPLGRPLAMHPAYAVDAARNSSTNPQQDRTYQTVHGVACISIVGTLYQYTRDDGTGYDWIKATLIQALNDPHVSAIALIIDSGGGEVSGCFDLVDFIYSSRSVKPIMAICSESAYSAAYALASACEMITVPRTGGVGSIGVIAAHSDHSGAMDKKGVSVTLVHFGTRKADGNEMRPLSVDAHARMQADVDAMGDLFAATVARNRGISKDAVIATQAGTFMGQAGVDAGLADAVLSPDDAFIALLEQLG